jgi:hypothetical protein
VRRRADRLAPRGLRRSWARGLLDRRAFARRFFARSSVHGRRRIVALTLTVWRLLALFVPRRLRRVLRAVMPLHETGRGGNTGVGSGVGVGSGGGTPSGAGAGLGPGGWGSGVGGFGSGGVICMIMNRKRAHSGARSATGGALCRRARSAVRASMAAHACAACRGRAASRAGRRSTARWPSMPARARRAARGACRPRSAPASRLGRTPGPRRR